MRAFASLYSSLDASTATADKLATIRSWLAGADPAEAAWGIHLLAGARVSRVLAPAALRRLAAESSGLPAWLVDECYAHVGDLAETVALLSRPAAAAAVAPQPERPAKGLAEWVDRVLALRSADDPDRAAIVRGWLEAMDPDERFVLLKLLTGALRVGISRGLVVRAVAEHAGLPRERVAERLSGGWSPSAASFVALIAPEDARAEGAARPVPFCLACALTDPVESLGARDHWLAEWKWDGIRAQLARTGEGVRLWSRGDEALDGRFPEIERAARELPEGVVLDGEILAWGADVPLPFMQLQRRINRRKPGPRLLAECPVRFIAYDCLRDGGQDLRERPLRERRARLEGLIASTPAGIGLSPAQQPEDWEGLSRLRDGARVHGVEGLMLKRLDSPYRAGRRRGDWWKWKLEPLTIDAVLVYAQAGRGRRAGLHTDYTFALWHGDVLLPVAKAYSGLDDAEIARLDRWVRNHTIDRFGPVRQVEALQVFEIGFDAVQQSSRHKSGIAVRFPRILRWREDKPAREADRLETLRALAAGA
jgi:DNA ligase-1